MPLVMIVNQSTGDSMSNRQTRAKITDSMIRAAAASCGPYGITLRDYARAVNVAHSELARRVAAYRRYNQ